MIHSKRALEGELVIDHRESPGVPDDLFVLYQRDHPAVDVPRAPKNTLLEAATITCSHCSITIVRGPHWDPANHYCASCDRYICNVCKFHQTHSSNPRSCFPMSQRLDEVQEALVTGRPSIILTDLL